MREGRDKPLGYLGRPVWQGGTSRSPLASMLCGVGSHGGFEQRSDRLWGFTQSSFVLCNSHGSQFGATINKETIGIL
jgi:hypothetical protein